MRALALLAGLLLAGGASGAQRPAAEPVRLEVFVQQVAHLWDQGDVAGLLDLARSDGPLMLDTGGGGEQVDGRHAAAALRALFAGRDNLSARPVRVTVSGGAPPRGFGELVWRFRTRGAKAPQARSLYVGAVWEGAGWRISELRIMP